METIEGLRKEIEQLKNQQGMLVKTGEIIYIHPKESPTEKMDTISIGLDCTEVLNGRTFTSFLGMQVTSYSKELFSQFNRTEGNDKLAYKVGDVVKVMCNVEGRSVNKDKKNGDRDIIYNNVSLERVRLVTSSTPGPNTPADVAGSATNEQGGTDDVPF